MANLHELKQVTPVKEPLGYFTKLNEASIGKDTMTGHWELMGLHITKPFKTFSEKGFPQELIDELIELFKFNKLDCTLVKDIFFHIISFY